MKKSPILPGNKDASPEKNTTDSRKRVQSPDMPSGAAGRLNIRPQTRRLTQLAFLGTLALVISGLEWMIPPLPMLPPGAKPGLSNIVTMYSKNICHKVISLFLSHKKSVSLKKIPPFSGFCCLFIGLFWKLW